MAAANRIIICNLRSTREHRSNPDRVFGHRRLSRMTPQHLLILSPREKQLLRRFASGKTDREIARNLGGTESQVAAQRSRLTSKLQIETANQLCALGEELAVWPQRRCAAKAGRRKLDEPPSAQSRFPQY
jgi:DNA-binding CsgD family transcriptional regulator